MEFIAKIESVQMNSRQYTRQSDGQTGFAHQVEMSTDSGRIGFEVFFDEESMKNRGFVAGAIGTISAATRCRRYTDKYGNQRIATDVDIDSRSWRLANQGISRTPAQQETSQQAVAEAMAEAAAVAEANIDPNTGLPF